MCDQNTQRCFGVTQISPINVTLPDEVRQIFKMSSFGVQAKVFVKFMYKTFITFAKQKTSIVGQESTFDAILTETIVQSHLQYLSMSNQCF